MDIGCQIVSSSVDVVKSLSLIMSTFLNPAQCSRNNMPTEEPCGAIFNILIMIFCLLLGHIISYNRKSTGRALQGLVNTAAWQYLSSH